MKITIEALNKLIEDILGKKHKLHYSLYDTEEKENEDFEKWIAKLPFNSVEDVFNQGLTVFTNYNRKSKHLNPTWKTVIKVANKFAYGDHVFLEDIRFDREENNVKYYKMIFGS